MDIPYSLNVDFQHLNLALERQQFKFSVIRMQSRNTNPEKKKKKKNSSQNDTKRHLEYQFKNGLLEFLRNLPQGDFASSTHYLTIGTPCESPWI